MDRRRTASWILLAALISFPGCDRGSGSSIPWPVPVPVPVPIVLRVDAYGGNALGTSVATVVNAGSGGTCMIFSEGAITSESSYQYSPPINQAEPFPPVLPVPPSSGTFVSSADLSGTSYTLNAGNIQISGTVVTPAVAVYTITCTSGDIVIKGSLLAGDGAGPPTALVLNAPGGTVFVEGGIASENSDPVPDGDDGASLSINANRIVVSGGGTLRTRGETPGGDGGSVTLTVSGGASPDVLMLDGRIESAGAALSGNGGAVTIDAAGGIYLHQATVDTQGGGGSGTGNLSGGNGGPLSVLAPDGMDLYANLLLSGGGVSSDGNAIGGKGGDLSINVNRGSTGPVTLYGGVSTNGGVASGAAVVQGGAAGGIYVGSSSQPGIPGAPSSVEVGPIRVIGGWCNGADASATSSCGDGGTIQLTNDYASPGDITCRFLTASGGSVSLGVSSGGNGGSIVLKTTTGDIRAVGAGNINALGGLGFQNGSGGAISVTIGGPAVATSGNFIVYTGMWIRADGGGSLSLGSGGGDGGSLTIDLRDSSAGVSPNSSALFGQGSYLGLRGGTTAAGAGGDGGVLSITAKGHVTFQGSIAVVGGDAPGFAGAGGFIDVLSDPDGTGGANILMAYSSTNVDIGGGSSSAAAGGSARNDGVPGVTNDLTKLAVRFRAGSTGTVTNNGTINARGGVANGSGGDILFEGAGTPVPGTQNRGGTGSGSSGDYQGN